MRWHDQLEQRHRAGQLPGMDDVVTRTFDAPEAMSAQFHEIHAKSVLNRVPGAAKLPFGWTVNTYRGCLHSCSYCTSGDTPILMGSGRTRPMKDIRPGDVIYGTEFDGKYRRYVKTTVLDHWSSVKPAFRTRLADGTELVTSGDHRFLSNRGWKHVTGSMAGPEQRPYLTTANSLIGLGASAERPKETFEYAKGYLTGMVRGDGHLKEYAYPRPGGGTNAVRAFRLALTDEEALHRAELYLALYFVGVRERQFAAATERHRAITSITTARREGFDRVREVIQWPLDPCDDWCKGFLAGIFDAEGSCSGFEALRISNADSMIIAWICRCLERFGFAHTIEDYGRPNRHRVVRLLNGLREKVRFMHLVDPAITRKRDLLEGRAIKSDADLRVVSIDSLGMAMRLYDITTGTGDFIANGVVSHNCFARPTHEYLDLDAGRDFEQQIIVKVNAPEVLRAELRKPSWTFEHIALGTNTDPYQWVEKRYGLTRSVLEVLRDARNPCSVLTKSPLLLRDLELFKELREVTDFSACLSIPTLDEKAWRSTEPATPHPRKRLEAVAELNAAGIPTGVLVAPLMPGINDSDEQVAAVVEACREAGATRVGGQALFLRGATKDVFMGYLRSARPDLVPLYERLYGGGAWLRPDDKKRVEAPLRRRARAYEPGLAPRFQRDAPGVLAFANRRLETPATAPVGPPATTRVESPAVEAGEAPRNGHTDPDDVLTAAERRRPQPRQEALF